MTDPIHILVIEGRYYKHISDGLLFGAETTLKKHGATSEVVTVTGALEIPQILAAAIQAGLFKDGSAKPFHGCVALGCVIRGETSHYDIVAGESARALMQLATEHGIPVGNGILTVDNEAQAIVRSSVGKKDKGRDAVEACLDVIRARRDFSGRQR